MSKQKKRWYDYLWIASLTYLVLGFFNIPVCVAGADLFSCSTDYFHSQWNKRIL